eukprot:TRINITY_DN762_c0_g1_i1.p1 TRINITY_DN762_c0_g1~~TRINITY_DN762_c0_g1_i1.p1  ORF type:complete len:121 (-),score=20.73 TRINITY_DN762_c0_g1_i1:177-539(-)
MAEQSQNNVSDQPTLCAKGCGFWGNTATSNMCSKCWRDSQSGKINPLEKQSAAPQAVSTPKPVLMETETEEGSIQDNNDKPIIQDNNDKPMEVDEPDPKPIQEDTTRCWSCKKKSWIIGI